MLLKNQSHDKSIPSIFQSSIRSIHQYISQSQNESVNQSFIPYNLQVFDETHTSQEQENSIFYVSFDQFDDRKQHDGIREQESETQQQLDHHRKIHRRTCAWQPIFIRRNQLNIAHRSEWNFAPPIPKKCQTQKRAVKHNLEETNCVSCQYNASMTKKSISNYYPQILW